MEKKRIVFFISGAIAFFIIAIISFNIINYYKWKEPLVLNNNFIVTWGNYDYKNYNKYSDSIKPLITNTLYAEYFEGAKNEQSYYIQQGKMVTNKSKVETSIVKIMSKEVDKDKYIVKSRVNQSVTVSGKTATNTKTATITIIKDGDKYFVSEISYD